MIAAVEAGEVNRIVVYMIDRLYRQPRKLEDLIDLAISGRVEVVSTHSGEGIDLSSIDGATMARVVVALASAETRKISARVLRQQADRRRKGLHHGATRPLGYKRVKVPNFGTNFVPKPDEAALINAAMHSVLGGMSLADIAREWTKLGVPHPHHSRKMMSTMDTISHVLSLGGDQRRDDPSIAEKHRNAHASRRGASLRGMAADRYHRPVRRRCIATIRQRTKRGTAPPRRGMLTGLMHCGVCGAKMHRGRSAKGGYYRCPADTCGKVGIMAEFVDALTLAAVRERLGEHEFKFGEGQTVNSKALVAIEQRLNVIDRKVEELAIGWADQRSSPASSSPARFAFLAARRLEDRRLKLLAERDAILAVSPAVHFTPARLMRS